MTQIDEIRARLQNITTGSWRNYHDFQVVSVSSGDLIATVDDVSDCEFIANAPDDITALLAEVDRMAGQLKRAATLIDELAQNYNDNSDFGSYCVHCGAKSTRNQKHQADCPITIARAILAELDGAK